MLGVVVLHGDLLGYDGFLPDRAKLTAISYRPVNSWQDGTVTLTGGDALDAAVRWCAEHGLTFDAVNENLPERIALYASDSRKVSADEYWDDRAIRLNAGEVTHAVLD